MSDREQDYAESSDGDGRPGLPIDPLRLWLILKRSWQVVVAAGVIGAFVGAAVAKKVVPQTFTARATVTWEGEGPPASTAIDSFLLTSNLEEAKRRLGFQMPAEVLRSSLDVRAAPGSTNITVAGVWADADDVARLTNAVVDVAVAQVHETEKQRNLEEVARMREAVESAAQRHTAAAAAYEQFRTESGISDVSREREMAIQQVAALATQADVARAEAAAARSELERLRAQVGDAPSQGPTISAVEEQQADQDRQRLVSARRELAAAQVQYAADHPNVLRLAAEVSAIEKRLEKFSGRSSGGGARRLEQAQRQEAQAALRQKTAEEYAAQVRDRLSTLSSAEGRAAALLSELRVAEQALTAAKGMLTAKELESAQPPKLLSVVERAAVPAYPMESARKKVALAFPIGSVMLALVGVFLWSLRKLDVCTPSEAAFWSNLPVVGASTWPRDPDMLASLMHDLDDYAPNCVGVTLIVGASLEEAHLARKVSEWSGHSPTGQPFGAVDEQRLLTAGRDIDADYAIVAAGDRPMGSAGRGDAGTGPREAPNMQILTLTGPVPAQALRRAARLADRVLVVVTSGKHSIVQLMKIRNRLGRDEGIGVLLVGLDKDLAMVRDRVGAIERFWYATKAQGRAEAVS